MSLNRFLLSLAWKFFPYGKAQIKTIHKVRVPLRARGDFASLEETFIHQLYVPLLQEIPHPVLSWLDLGCNAGIFSAWLYDRAVAQGKGPECQAVLVDPGSCIKTAQEFIRLNQLTTFKTLQVCVGDGSDTIFYESKSSTRSSSAIQPDSREKKVPVKTMTGVSLLQKMQIKEWDLVKIDIEGAEKFLIQDDVLFKHFRAGIIEWHAETTSGHQVAEWVTRNGGKIIKMVAQDGTQGDILSARLGILVWLK